MPAILRSVVPVDRDVFLGEIAGQYAIAALAHSERDADLNFWVLHRSRHFGFIVGRSARASAGDANAVERNRELVSVGGFAGLADRHHHPAPIGVLSRDRGFYQR